MSSSICVPEIENSFFSCLHYFKSGLTPLKWGLYSYKTDEGEESAKLVSAPQFVHTAVFVEVHNLRCQVADVENTLLLLIMFIMIVLIGQLEWNRIALQTVQNRGGGGRICSQ